MLICNEHWPFVILGGLAAVIYTDAAQTVVMLAGALTLMGFSMFGSFCLSSHQVIS